MIRCEGKELDSEIITGSLGIAGERVVGPGVALANRISGSGVSMSVDFPNGRGKQPERFAKV